MEQVSTKIRYPLELTYRRYVQGYGFLSFARNFGSEFPKTAGIRKIQKSAEATGDLIGNKIADKITSLGKSKNKEKETSEEEIIIPSEKRQQIINDLILF